MDKNLAAVIERRIECTVQALRANNMDAFRVADTVELYKKLDDLMNEGSTWSVGGSMTLFEAGVIDYLKKGPYTYFDRYAEGADLDDVYAKAQRCDVYFCSSNAITEDGKLYNVDGRGNRISNLIFGPKRVVVIAGYNKIVKDIEAARQRADQIASPANAERLNVKDYKTICSHELVSQQQVAKGRITVLILAEQYGY